MEKSSNFTIERNKIISATKKTFKFGKSFYQTQNITGFSEGDINLGSKIPWKSIFSILIIGLIMINIPFGDSNIYQLIRTIGIFLVIVASFGTILNFLNRKEYGLLVTLNSGDKTLFITNDRESLKRVIRDLYNFIESEEKGNSMYQISISNSVVKGNLVQGEVGTDVSFNSNNDDYQDIY